MEWWKHEKHNPIWITTMTEYRTQEILYIQIWMVRMETLLSRKKVVYTLTSPIIPNEEI